MKDCIYKNLSINDYHNDRSHFSSTAIKEAFKSLEHFRFHLNKPQEKKLHFDFGNALELKLSDVLNNSNLFEKEVAIFDERKRPSENQTFAAKINKAWKFYFYEKNENKLIIPAIGEDSLEIINILIEQLTSHPVVSQLLTNTKSQESIFWTDENTGLKLKTRPDFYKPSTPDRKDAIIIDLKTDRESEVDKQLKKIFNLNYPLQAVLQIEGLIQSKLIGSDFRYFWVVASKSEPYNVEVYKFNIEDYYKFKDAFSFKLDEIKRATDNNSFKNYEVNKNKGIIELEIPFWYKKKLNIK